MITKRRVLLTMMVLAATRAWSAGVGLVASPFQNPAAGNDIVVSVTGTSLDGVSALDLSYSYDPTILTPTGVFTTAYSHGASLTWSFATPGVVEIHITSSTPFSGCGDLAWVTFRIASGATVGATPLSWVATSLNGGSVPCAEQASIVNVAAAPVTIAAPRSAFGLHGTQVLVPVSATGLTGGSSFDLSVSFDPNVLSAASVQKTSFDSCMSLTSNLSTPGTVRISLYGLCTLTGNGPLAMIVFNVVGANGTRTPLNVTRGSIDEDHYPSVLQDGLFNVCGTPDADGDGYSVCAGDCNDNDPSIHPGAVETCNGIDDDCNGIVDDAVPPKAAPSIRIDEELGEAFLSWAPVAQSTAYDVLRGDLALLRPDGVAGSTDICVGSRVTTNYMTDGLFPPVGDGFWYLARAANCGGPGSYDANEPRQVVSRDIGFNLTQHSCP